MLALAFASCSPGGTANDGRLADRPPVEGRALEAPAGRRSPVAALGWGGPSSDRRLGVLLVDGRFAVYRPSATAGPISVGLTIPSRGPITALAIPDADRVVTGDGRGLLLWATDEAVARPIDRYDCGDVSAMALEPIGPGDLHVGLADGGLLRLRPNRDEIGPTLAEVRDSGPGPAVVGLDFVDQGRSVVVCRADGGAEARPRSLEGPIEDLGPTLAAADLGGRVVRLLGSAEGGPSLRAEGSDSKAGWRFALPAEGFGLAPVLRGRGLIAACEGRVLLLSPEGNGPLSPEMVRAHPSPEGPTRIAADPDDPNGRRVALGDAEGGIVVFDAEALRESAAPIPPDNVADLAFRPDRRCYHPRAGLGRVPDYPDRIADRLDDARRRLDRGIDDGLMPLLVAIEEDPGLDRDAAAELAVLLASARQDAGWSLESIRRPIGQALATAALRGWNDRQGDLLLWDASLLLPPFDGLDGPDDPAELERALADCRRAAASFRAADYGLERQSRIAEALAAWGLLALGRPREAQQVFAEVARYAEVDPVLRQAPEFDRIASALAVARGDWESADAASDRLLRRLDSPPPDRRALAREAAMERVGVLAALGRWAEASIVLAPERPGDPEWTLRRATVRDRAGLLADREPIDPEAPIATPEAAIAAHVAGRIAADDPERRALAAHLLDRVAEAHRHQGRVDLALEAELETAEAQERLDRPGDALAHYARVARALGAGTERSPIRGAARPLDDAVGRVHRGLARCQVALGRPEHALGAIEEAMLVDWFDRIGMVVVRASALASPESGIADESLRAARRVTLGSGVLEAESARVRRLEHRRAAGHRELIPGDPLAPIDPDALGLEADEALLVVAAIGPETLLGVLIRPGSPIAARVLPATRADLRHAARLWRAGLGDGGRPCELEPSRDPGGLLAIAPEPDLDTPAGPRGDSTAAPAGLLHDAVFGPFLDELSGVDRLLILPDDALAAIPPAALQGDEPIPAATSIRYVPSLSVLRRARDGSSRDRSTRGVLFVGRSGDAVGPLAVRSTYRTLGLPAEVLVDPVDLPGRLVDFAATGFGVLHLGARAVMDPSASLTSGAMLRFDAGTAAGSAGSGLAEGRILGFGLAGAVVVLDLDHHPLPAVAPPNAWRDLAASWLSAGAVAVVVSLWDPPEDSGPAFLAELHHALALGDDPAEALARARSSIASRPGFEDPVHWSGFVLYQPGRPEM